MGFSPVWLRNELVPKKASPNLSGPLFALIFPPRIPTNMSSAARSDSAVFIQILFGCCGV